MTKNVALFVYTNVDLNMLETCISSLKKVSKCDIVVFTDDVPKDTKKFLGDRILWITSPTEMIQGRRALFKVQSYCSFGIKDRKYENVMVADVDILFLRDPFEVFKGDLWDIGLTGRGYEYHFPINAGIIFYRTWDRVRKFLEWHSEECESPKWDFYKDWRVKHNHVRFGPDWTVGQDFLNCCWIKRDDLMLRDGLIIVDVGSSYNYCPARDLFGVQKCKDMIREEYLEGEVSVLHLKSSLKGMIYEGCFKEAIIRHPNYREYNWRDVKKSISSRDVDGILT